MAACEAVYEVCLRFTGTYGDHGGTGQSAVYGCAERIAVEQVIACKLRHGVVTAREGVQRQRRIGGGKRNVVGSIRVFISQICRDPFAGAFDGEVEGETCRPVKAAYHLCDFQAAVLTSIGVEEGEQRRVAVCQDFGALGQLAVRPGVTHDVFINLFDGVSARGQEIKQSGLIPRKFKDAAGVCEEFTRLPGDGVTRAVNIGQVLTRTELQRKAEFL